MIGTSKPVGQSATPANGNTVVGSSNIAHGTFTSIADATTNRGGHITVGGITNANLKGYFGIDTDEATPYLAINFVEEGRDLGSLVE